MEERVADLSLPNPAIPSMASSGQGATADPFARFTGLLQMQNYMNNIRLFNQEYAARQRLGQIAQQSVDENGNFNMDMFSSKALGDPIAGPFAGAQLNQMRQAQLGQLQADAQRQNIMGSAWNGLSKTLATVQDPNLLPSALSGWLAQQPDFVRGKIAGPASDLIHSLTATADGKPIDPRVLRARLTQLGVAGGLDANQMNNTFGTTSTPTMAGPNGINQPVAGVTLPAGQGGGFVPSGSTTPMSALPQGMSPEDAQKVVTTPSGTPARAATALPPVVSSGAQPAAGGAAPAAPGIAGPVQEGYFKDRGTELGEYQKMVDNNVTAMANMMTTVQEAQKAKADFKPGAGASIYNKVAQIAQGLGAPKELVDRIGNGDLGAGQEFNKLMVDTTMSRIKAALAGIGGSRINQIEFEHFTENNPNIDTDPNAIDKIFKFWNHIYQMNKDEQSSLRAHVKAGGDIQDWPTKWQDMLQNKYGIGETEATAATSGMLNNAPAPAAGPARYKYVPGQGLVKQ